MATVWLQKRRTLLAAPVTNSHAIDRTVYSENTIEYGRAANVGSVPKVIYLNCQRLSICFKYSRMCFKLYIFLCTNSHPIDRTVYSENTECGRTANECYLLKNFKIYSFILSKTALWIQERKDQHVRNIYLFAKSFFNSIFDFILVYKAKHDIRKRK